MLNKEIMRLLIVFDIFESDLVVFVTGSLWEDVYNDFFAIR